MTAVLITGASGGVGREAAIECANRGARVAVHYNSHRERAEAVLADLPGDGHCLLQCDITDPDAVQQLVEQADNELGGLDVLVNNAGVSQRHDIAAIDYAIWQESWHRIVDTNLTSAANLSYCASQKMIPNGGWSHCQRILAGCISRGAADALVRRFQGRYERDGPVDGASPRAAQGLRLHGRPGFYRNGDGAENTGITAG
jgi:NAD(P)-dependent dehydrogenase (short-subunit alcohol dehydrogenase family)